MICKRIWLVTRLSYSTIFRKFGYRFLSRDDMSRNDLRFCVISLGSIAVEGMDTLSIISWSRALTGEQFIKSRWTFCDPSRLTCSRKTSWTSHEAFMEWDFRASIDIDAVRLDPEWKDCYRRDFLQQKCIRIWIVIRLSDTVIHQDNWSPRQKTRKRETQRFCSLTSQSYRAQSGRTWRHSKNSEEDLLKFSRTNISE